MKYLIFSSTLLFFVLLGCKVNQNNTKDAPQKLVRFEQVAQKKFNKPYNKLYNTSKTYVVCFVINKGTEQSPFNQLHLLLFDAKTNELIYTSKKTDGEVKWLTDKRIQITTPAKNPKLSSVTEVYDVEKRRNVQVSSDL